jgi:hypothetical protein
MKKLLIWLIKPAVLAIMCENKISEVIVKYSYSTPLTIKGDLIVEGDIKATGDVQYYYDKNKEEDHDCKIGG